MHYSAKISPVRISPPPPKKPFYHPWLPRLFWGQYSMEHTTNVPVEFFLNGAKLSLNSVNSGNLIKHWSMNSAHFKDPMYPISHLSCSYCGSILVSYKRGGILVSYTRGGRFKPLCCNGKYFWIPWNIYEKMFWFCLAGKREIVITTNRFSKSSRN